MKQVTAVLALTLGLTACANTSLHDGEIENVRLADSQFAYQDDGLRWWRRHWVQPYALFRRTSYRAANWELITNPQTQYRLTLQLVTQAESRPGPVLEFRCEEAITSFAYQDVNVFSPFHSNFEVFIDVQNTPRWTAIANRRSPRVLSIDTPDSAARIFTQLDGAMRFTIAVRDATPVRARFVVDRSDAVFSEFRSRCASLRQELEIEGGRR